MRFLVAVVFCLLIAPVNAVTASEHCLALAVYKEAGSTSQRSQRAVLDVLQNRMRAEHRNACQVVSQKKQWSWYSSSLPLVATRKMLASYREIVDNVHVLPKSAMWFHNKSVKPKWTNKMVVVARIDGQVFYRKKYNG